MVLAEIGSSSNGLGGLPTLLAKVNVPHSLDPELKIRERLLFHEAPRMLVCDQEKRLSHLGVEPFAERR